MSTAILYDGTLISDVLTSFNGNKKNFFSNGRVYIYTVKYAEETMQVVTDTDEFGNEFAFREPVLGEPTDERIFIIANLGTSKDSAVIEMILSNQDLSMIDDPSESFAAIVYSIKDKKALVFHDSYYPVEISTFETPIVIGTGSKYVEGAFEISKVFSQDSEQVSALKLMKLASTLDHDTSTQCEYVNSRNMKLEVKRMSLP
jgi:hypothetical protein